MMDKYLLKIFENFKKSDDNDNDNKKLIWLHQYLPNEYSKPYPYRTKSQNYEIADQFYNQMEEFIIENNDIYNIESLDYRKLGENVVSWDGTHYTFGNGIMRNQILLNCLEAGIFDK